MTITGDKVIFETTGREIYAYLDSFEFTQELNGSNGQIKGLWIDEEPILSQNEQIELADFMIARWQEFRKRAEAEKIA